MKQQFTEIPLSNRIGRYAAFINSMRWTPNAKLENMRRYYRISNNVTWRDLIECGAFDSSGEPTETPAYDVAKLLTKSEFKSRESYKRDMLSVVKRSAKVVGFEQYGSYKSITLDTSQAERLTRDQVHAELRKLATRMNELVAML